MKTPRPLEEIENLVGHFIYMDPRGLGARDKLLAWILVEIEYNSEILEHTDLEWGIIILWQLIAFWGIPFHCIFYHRIGNLLNRCLEHLCAPLMDRVMWQDADVGEVMGLISLIIRMNKELYRWISRIIFLLQMFLPLLKCLLIHPRWSLLLA